MSATSPSPTFFSPEEWKDQIIRFGHGLSRTEWKLGAKLSEAESRSTPLQDNHWPEAWAAFLCKSYPDGAHEAVMKIRMQIPEMGTEFESHTSRARQARPGVTFFTKHEKTALEMFEASDCPSAPQLLDYKEDKQTIEMPVHGGSIAFIVMTKVPGENLSTFWTKPPKEREEIRDAFKDAYEDVLNCGVCPSLTYQDNLIWDSTEKRTYIVDFKSWHRRRKRDKWSDTEWLAWDLADSWGTHDLNDKSHWRM